MMEQNPNQPELFEEFKQPRRPFFDFARWRRRLFPRENLYVRLSYESAIFIAISVLLLLIITFTVGVERGKRMIARPQPLSELIVPAAPPFVQPASPASSTFNYTVQIASLNKQDFAQRELEKLNKQGLDAFIKESGNFYVLCVGQFQTKEQATEMMKRLRPRYRDCFVRKK